MEMLVTLAVLGILAAVAIPSMSRSTDSHRVVEQSRRVHTDLTQARTRAIAEQRRYRVGFNGGNSWRIQYDAAGTWTDLGTPRTLPTGISLRIDGSSGGTVHYGVHGREVATRTIVISDTKGHDQRIVVRRSGMTEWFAN